VDLAAECQRAEILVGAIGRPAFLTAEHIRPGAVVIDVGINRITERSEAAAILRNEANLLAEFDRKGKMLVGDTHPLDAMALAGAWTPVPGGVGPLTIAMLMSNTVEAAERRQGC
jgi:methylenetetrahydrofolate dehydrogenase (NADP+)/methenyltetrahydrofolate cyclohydrolase